MTELGTAKPSDELRQAAANRPHLREHLKKFKQITGEFPLFIDQADGEYETDYPNVLYPVGGPIYCHIYGDVGRDMKYYAIEPTLTDEESNVYDEIKDELLRRSVAKQAPESESEYGDRIEELLSEATRIEGENPDNLLEQIRFRLDPNTEEVSQNTFENIRYRLNRDIVGLGPLEPVMRDPANEDIHVIGPDECSVDHEVYGMLTTTVDFGTEEEYDNWLRNMGERIGDPLSDSDPIVDSTLPDGSRLNVIYSDDVSLKGPSLTIRQGSEVPLSVNQITNWGTLSP